MACAHVAHSMPAATTKSLAKPTNAPALTPTDMKAVTGVGAPSYTSGAQLWKGTAEILKPKPVTTSTKATTSRPRASTRQAGEPGGDAGVVGLPGGRVQRGRGRRPGWPTRRRR